MKNKIYIQLLLLITSKVFGQITPPTPAPNGFINALMVGDTKEPSVARFQEYSFVPVDMYSGKAKMEIPFFKIKIDGLEIPISLEYNTQGIQVNSVASRVGTGWVLNAGGNIGKTVKEVNDFSFLARYFYGSVGTSGMPLDCSGPNGSLGYPLRVGWKYRNTNVCVSTLPMPQAGPNNIDISPDIYTASAPGLRSQFYYPDSEVSLEPNIDKQETTNPQEIEPINAKYASRIKDIQIAFPNVSNLPSFFQQIPSNRRYVRDYFDFDITHNGFKYSFNDYDLSYVNSPSSYYDSEPWGGINHEELNWDVSAWHLNKIENVNTNNKIQFIYESVPFYTTSQLKYKYYLDQPEYGNYIKPPQYNDIYETNVHLYPKRIKEIISDEATIRFQYDHARKDLIGDYALTNVQVFNTSNQLIKEFRFSYYYMNAGAGDGFDKRLYLDHIEEVGSANNTVKRYTFSYFKGDLPGSNSTNNSDWYGYYKTNYNGGDRPVLFMNTNLKDFSVLPVQLQGMETFSLRGNRPIYPDAIDMRVGMLKRINYPTGGYAELEYEANKFRISNQEVTGGGLRIARQTLSDGNIIRKFKYTYTEPDGLTSGYVNSIPSYGYMTSEPPEGVYGSGSFDNFTHQEKQDFIGGTFLTMVRSLTGVDKTQNTYVGYSLVKEEEEGKGYTNYKYASPKEYPSIKPAYIGASSLGQNFIINNTSFPNLNIQMNLDVRTGQLLSKEIYNMANQLQRKENYQYDYKLLNEMPLERFRYFPFVNNNYNGFDIKSKIFSHRSTLAEKHTLDYFNSPVPVEKVEKYEYDPLQPLVKRADAISGENTLTTKFYYPKDILANGIQTAEMQKLLDQKRDAETVKTESYKNNMKVDEKATKYATSAETNNKLQPVASFESMNPINIDSNEDKVFSIDKYDEKGHILQTTDKSGVPTSIVWGYHKTLPIAKITGAAYSEIAGAVSNIVDQSDHDIDPASEQLLLTALSAFRNGLPANFQVTTYTYDPLVGVTNILDPSGVRKTYKYDTSSRLESISDDSGQIIERYKYNHALRFFNAAKSQTFTRNNCGAGLFGGPYTYTVLPNEFSSSISQPDADQQAQNEINLLGQSMANIAGTCSQPCPFDLVPGSGLHLMSSTIYSVANTVKFKVVVNNINVTPGYYNTAHTLGLISGDCKPSAVMEFTFDEPPGGPFGDTPANRTWKIRIDAIGNVSMQLLSGSVGNNSYNQLKFQFEFQK